MEKVDLSKMDNAAVEKWLAEQLREEHRKLRSGELEPDWDHLELLYEELFHDIGRDGESIDNYWAKGWVTGKYSGTRSNYDEVDGRYYKAFPTRYRLADLKLGKNLRRVIHRNEGLARVIRPMRPTPKKDKLEERFDLYRFGDKPKNPLSNAYQNTKYYPTDLMETCVFDGDELLAISVFQIADTSAFGNYACRKPGYAGRSLGIFTVLLEMLHAKQLGKQFYYLGNYCKHNPWYQYKTRFPGMELYDWDNDVWVDLKDESTAVMLDQKLPLRPEIANDI